MQALVLRRDDVVPGSGGVYGLVHTRPERDEVDEASRMRPKLSHGSPELFFIGYTQAYGEFKQQDGCALKATGEAEDKSCPKKKRQTTYKDCCGKRRVPTACQIPAFAGKP